MMHVDQFVDINQSEPVFVASQPGVAAWFSGEDPHFAEDWIGIAVGQQAYVFQAEVDFIFPAIHIISGEFNNPGAMTFQLMKGFPGLIFVTGGKKENKVVAFIGLPAPEATGLRGEKQEASRENKN